MSLSGCQKGSNPLNPGKPKSQSNRRTITARNEYGVTLKRILIYRCGSLGDTIIALPALKLVARAFPDAERWMLTNFSLSSKVAALATVLDGTGLVDGYIEYPAGLRDPRGFWRLRQNIRALRADILVYLTEPHGWFHTSRNAAFFFGCGLWRQIGVPWNRRNRSVRRLGPNRWESEAARQARCVAQLGDARIEELTSYDLQLSAAEHADAAKLLAPLSGRTLIAVSVGAKVDTKDWEDVRWAPLLEYLARRYPEHGLVMLGSIDEARRCEALGVHWRGRVVNLCGRSSVRASGAALSRCAVFIGHDSGPMHLAAAVGTRCVAIFSSRNLPGEWFPCGDGHRILYQPISCQACRLDVCGERQKACIRSISVEAVLDATAEVLALSSIDAKPSLLATVVRGI